MSADKFDSMRYRLRSLEFQNGGRVGFRNASLLYNEAGGVVAVESPGVSRLEIRDALAQVTQANGALPEIKTIFYDMEIPGAEPVRFFHPLSPGAGVRVFPAERGGPAFFIMQENGRPIFTKEWTLSDVSGGRIKSKKSVWQFHGYRHEH